MGLKEQRAAELKAAQDIVDRVKAAGRDLTDTEAQQIEDHLEKARGLQEQLGRQEKSARLLDELSSGTEYDQDGAPLPSGEDGGDEGRRIVLGRKGYGAAVAERVMTARTVDGRKALPTDAVQAVPIVDTGLLVAENRRPLTIFDAIPAIVRPPRYHYRRAVGRSFAAGIVAPGAEKPESDLTLEEVDGRLEVFAHLTPGVDEYVLADAPELARFIGDELGYGLRLAVEEEVVNGSGEVIEGDTRHLTGLLSTTGTLDQEHRVDALTTIAAAAGQLEGKGHAASAFILNPSDWLDLTTARNSGGSFDFGAAVDAAQRRVWGVPVVTSETMPAGTAVGFASDAVAITTDSIGIQLRAGAVGDDFRRNRVRIRAEGRFGLDVYRPAGVVVAHLTDTAGA